MAYFRPKGLVTDKDELAFAMDFLDASKRSKDIYEPIRAEVLRNVLVIPNDDGLAWGDTDNPMRVQNTGWEGMGAILKSSATHSALMIYLAKLMLTLFGADDFIKCKRVGDEDVWAAKLASKLLLRGLTRPGVYRTMHVTLFDALIFGTATLFTGYEYEEQERGFRSVSYAGGVETTGSSRLMAPVKDDCLLFPVDYDDAFPESGVDTIPEMSGFGRRFVIREWEAEQFIETLGWNREATERACQGAGDASTVSTWRSSVDRDRHNRIPDAYRPLVGYELYAKTPYLHRDKARKRKLVILEEELVSTEAFPYHMDGWPFEAAVVNPIRGRFWGLAPGETMRFSQDFDDMLLMSIADAVVRDTRPPMVYHKGMEVDLSALLAFDPRVPIGVRGDPVQAVQTLNYKPQLSAAFNMHALNKQDMQDMSGAQGSLGGAEGPDREAASVGVQRYKNAMDRPELMASLLEREFLAGIGRNMLNLYQQFWTSDMLEERIGRIDGRTPALADILWEYDVLPCGSRRTQSQAEKLAMLERIGPIIGATPGAAPIFPWHSFIVELLTAANLEELEEEVSNPEAVANYIAMTRMQGAQGQPGNGNGEQPSKSPMGLMPAQASGEGPVG